MNHAIQPDFQDLMQRVASLTREGRLQEATQALQQSLGLAGTPPVRSGSTGRPAADERVLDGLVFEVEPEIASRASGPATEEKARSAAPSSASTFQASQFKHDGRTLAYKVFVPGGGTNAPRPVVMMLHGCTQNPDDFAAGTGMNRLAEEQGFIVAYPAQSQEANPQRCWNWFKSNHQQRGRGEPAVLAALARHVAQAHGGDPERVYVAGLSAGGAMAAVLAQAYPDVFAAAGVHSGLARGTASDAMGALQAMHSGAGPSGEKSPRRGRPAPTIVFHGDRDSTVHPNHGGHVMADSVPADGARPTIQKGVSAQGMGYTREVHKDAAGRVAAEYWVVHGGGHAWSGGHSSGSYTDPRGPDASREMLRFFLAHGRRSAA
jgi:poly(hydroxyalkanoate) depolymerase family esterase